MSGGHSAPPALRIRGLRKAFKDVRAVDGLDLEVAPGECFGLLGPNGAGKTTTIEICEGLNQPDAGEVEVLGLRWSSDQAPLRRRIGVSLQETQFSEKLTVLETVSLFRSFYDHGLEPLDRAPSGTADRESRARGSASSPAARSSGSRWPARSSVSPNCSFSTNPLPGSIRSRGASCGN